MCSSARVCIALHFQRLRHCFKPYRLEYDTTRPMAFNSPLCLASRPLQTTLAGYDTGGASTNESLRESVAQRLARAFDFERGKIRSLQVQQDNLEKKSNGKAIADAIVANLHTLNENKSETATVQAWSEDGTETLLEVTRDPTCTWHEQAQELYKEARKQNRGGEALNKLLNRSYATLEWLENAQEEFKESSSGSLELHRLARTLEKKGLGRVKVKAKKEQSQNPHGINTKDGIRSFKSPNGLEILVGRTSKANERLTLSMARKTDIWMHAVGPGAHVLLRCAANGSKRIQPERDCLETAADLAAFFCKQKGSSKISVHMADPANISKPKGAAVGSVALRRAKSIVGRPARIKGLLTEEEAKRLD